MTGEDVTIRVLLADDHVPVRDGLKRLIQDQPDMEVVGEAGDGPEALRIAQEMSPDIALVDVSMAGSDGVSLTREMSRACPGITIIAVTRHDEGGFVHRMMEAGASGYVLKQNATRHLIDAVRACVGGALYVDSGVRAAKIPKARTTIDAPGAGASEPLTAADENVLRVVAAGGSLRAVGERLGVSSADAAVAKDAAMRHAGLATLSDVVTYARLRGWIEPA